MGMKKLIPVVILATPAMILFLSMKLGIHFIVSNAADSTKIGERIQSSIPYILMANHLFLATLLFIFLKWQKIRVQEMGLNRPLKFACLGVGLGALIFSVQGLITLPLMHRFQLFEYWNGFPGFPFLLSATLFAGFVEELIFRGYSSRLLQRFNFNPINIWVLSTAAFAAIHYGQGVAGVINAVVMGGILGFAYHRVRSLPLVISGHMFANLFFIIYMTFRSSTL